MPPKESSLQAAVLARLRKIKAAGFPLAFRKRHGSPMGITGDPDIYGLWQGRHFEIELKRAGESPTLLQKARAAEWERAGASYALVTSMDEFERFLQSLSSGKSLSK